MKRICSAICLIGIVAFTAGFLGPKATQISVSTNSMTTIGAGGTNVQTMFDWLDDYLPTIPDGYVSTNYGVLTYPRLANNNTYSSGTTNNMKALTLSDILVATPSTENITNNGTLVLSGPSVIATSYGTTNGCTNYVYLPSPGTQGRVVILANSLAATNLLGVHMWTNTMRGPEFVLSAGEMAILFANSATNWFAIGQ